MMHAILGFALTGLLLSAPAQTKQPLRGLTIVVDAGHGGRDRGAPGTLGVDESDLVLDISHRLARRLGAAGARVVMTRTNEQNLLGRNPKVPNRQRANLNARVELAHRVHADLYISVHANKAPGYPSATGGQVFLGRKPLDQSRSLGSCVQQHLLAATHSRRLLDDRRELYLMEHLKMPSVLVEVGFLSNAAETRRMLTAEYQVQIAQAIVDGVECYAKAPPPAREPGPGRERSAHRRTLVAARGTQRPAAREFDVDTFARLGKD